MTNIVKLLDIYFIVIYLVGMALEIGFTSDDPGASYPGYDAAEPTIQSEKLAWWLRKQFHNMAGQSFIWQQEDMNEAITTILTWFDNLYPLIENWYSTCQDSVDMGGGIPSPPTLPTFSSSGPTSPLQIILIAQIQFFIQMVIFMMTEFFTGKWGNSGYAGKGSGDAEATALLDADVDAVEAWFDAAIAAKLAGNPIPAKPTLSSPADYGGLISGNSIALNTQNNIRLKINLSLMEGSLKGAVGLDEGDLQDLVDLLENALFSDTDEPILEALAATGLHITMHPSGAHIEYGDDS